MEIKEAQEKIRLAEVGINKILHELYKEIGIEIIDVNIDVTSSFVVGSITIQKQFFTTNIKVKL